MSVTPRPARGYLTLAIRCFSSRPTEDSLLSGVLVMRDAADSTAVSNHVAPSGTANRCRGLGASTPRYLADGPSRRDDDRHALPGGVYP